MRNFKPSVAFFGQNHRLALTNWKHPQPCETYFDDRDSRSIAVRRFATSNAPRPNRRRVHNRRQQPLLISHKNADNIGKISWQSPRGMATRHGHATRPSSRWISISKPRDPCPAHAMLASLPYPKSCEIFPSIPLGSGRLPFRNPEGVAFKLQNLRQVATGRGLANVSAVDREVWASFGQTPDVVTRLAALIRSESATAQPPGAPDDEGEEFTEGRLLTLVHKRREREKGLRPLLLRARRKSNGSLTCDACGDGPKTADDLLSDAGFEAHHTIPLQQAGPQGTATRVGDLALLCATCHRLLHRAMQVRKTWLSIADFKAVLASSEAIAAPSEPNA